MNTQLESLAEVGLLARQKREEAELLAERLRADPAAAELGYADALRHIAEKWLIIERTAANDAERISRPS